MNPTRTVYRRERAAGASPTSSLGFGFCVIAEEQHWAQIYGQGILYQLSERLERGLVALGRDVAPRSLPRELPPLAVRAEAVRILVPRARAAAALIVMPAPDPLAPRPQSRLRSP